MWTQPTTVRRTPDTYRHIYNVPVIKAQPPTTRPHLNDMSATFGAPPPSFGAPPPSFGAPLPTFGAPPLTFGAPPPSFGAPPLTFGAPPPSFGAPPLTFGAPPLTFGAPPLTFGTPPLTFGTPTAPLTTTPLTFGTPTVPPTAYTPLITSCTDDTPLSAYSEGDMYLLMNNTSLTIDYLLHLQRTLKISAPTQRV